MFLLRLLLSRAGAALVSVVALAGVLVWSHHEAYQRGRMAEKRAALERSVDLLRERNATDENIRRMDSAQLCRALGGEWVRDDTTCR